MRMRGERLRVFSGTAHPRLAQDICSFMGVPLGAASLQRFPDGEINLKVECDVRGADVFVVQPTSPNVHEHLFELLLAFVIVTRYMCHHVYDSGR